MNLDFTKFDVADKELTTTGLANVVDAVEKDMAAQRRKFSANRLSKRIHSVYTLNNRESFQRARYSRDSIQAGETAPLYTGSDLAKAIVYFLIDEGQHDWSETRTAVKQIGGNWVKLLELEPETERSKIIQQAQDELKRFHADSGLVADKLIEIAETIRPLEQANRELINRNMIQNNQILEILNQKTEVQGKYTKLRDAIGTMEDNITRALDAIEKETDIDKKLALTAQLRKFQQKFKSILG